MPKPGDEAPPIPPDLAKHIIPAQNTMPLVLTPLIPRWKRLLMRVRSRRP